MISLIGSSGSGKSTLLSCVNMLESCQQGDIQFCGEAVRWSGNGPNRVPADQAQVVRMRTQLSMVFQSFNLWAHMTVLKNVIEAPITVLKRQHGEAIDEAMALLEKVGIADKANVYPAQLSGGQQQRVAVARALVTEPVLLLADEPSANLDSATTTELLELFQRLNSERSMTIVTATHDPTVMRYAGRRVHMVDGRIERDESG